MVARSDLRPGTEWEDKNGKRVRITGIDKENVHWVNAEGVDTGNTNIENFLDNYCEISPGERRIA